MELKIKCYLDFFSLVLRRNPSQKLMKRYFTEDDVYPELADFVLNNMRKQINWSTAIGIIEAAEHIYNEAISNGNIKNAG
jgi:hypothetical protein